MNHPPQGPSPYSQQPPNPYGQPAHNPYAQQPPPGPVNPYAAPAAGTDLAYTEAPADEHLDASLGRRFGNYMIDGIIVAVVNMGLTFGMATAVPPELMAGMGLLPIVVSYLLVWVIPEGLWGRSLGKLATSTKVVDLQGNPPTFSTVLLRTLIRLVPFEPFSFLWGEPRGWHDTWTKTRVVMNENPYAHI